MKRGILVTAGLLALTFAGRTVFDQQALAIAIKQPYLSQQVMLQNSGLKQYGGEFTVKLTLQNQGRSWNVLKTEELENSQSTKGVIKDFAAGFKEPERNKLRVLMAVVREYLKHRQEAIVTQDPNKLWSRYPALKNTTSQTNINSDIKVNSLPSTLNSGVKPISGNITPEAREKIKIKVSGNRVQVLVRGIEVYRYSNSKETQQ